VKRWSEQSAFSFPNISISNHLNKTRQDKTKQNKQTKQKKTKQNKTNKKTKQNKRKRNKTKQNKTKQTKQTKKKTSSMCMFRVFYDCVNDEKRVRVSLSEIKHTL
jgi:hypothetical protein